MFAESDPSFQPFSEVPKLSSLNKSAQTISSSGSLSQDQYLIV